MTSHETTAACSLALEQVRRISIMRSVLKDPAVSLAIEVIDRFVRQDEASATCAELFQLLAENAELSDQPVVGNAWQNALMEAILGDDNVFARKAELGKFDEMGSSMLMQTKFDLAALRQLYDLDIALLLDGFASLDHFAAEVAPEVDEARLAIKQRLDACSRWADCAADLAEFHAASGAGEFGRFRAFRWSGKLSGVASPDPIRLSDLVEYDWQREAVARNTRKLLAGLPANNMLLYGDRGTGKSSTVKAMLNEFAGQKLRLVEVAKEDLKELSHILSILRNRPEKFILFIDDLSFEENETEYKALKAVLEGGLEARPANVALYATSNRRNLIRERFSDRVKEDDEVHPGDTMQEKLSLSDRFGIKVPFLAPDQEEFLRIVAELAVRAGIEMTEDLRKKSLAWQHARSGRSARQFVDYWIGEMGL